jgi:enterochelin esterase-like enzyme
MSVCSKRIEVFKKAAMTDQQTALEDLRSDLQVARGPLLEPFDEGNVLVTFVWIGPERQVSVRGAQLFEDHMAMSHPMTRVKGTDVWYLSTVAPANATTVYQYLVDDPFIDADRRDLAELTSLLLESRQRSFADPFNPSRIYPQAAAIAGEEDTAEERWESILDLPKAEPVTWFDDTEVISGMLTEHRFVSGVLDNERIITVYTPPGYTSTGEQYPLVIMLDGESWPRIARLHVGLDNLIGARRITPPVVAFVHNPTSPSAMASRIAEMSCNPALASMLADELLPMLRDRYHLTSDPVHTVTGGASLGGLAAAHAAFERPEAFGGVLSCSGAHWWGYTSDPEAQTAWGKDSEPEWLTRQYAAAPRKPIRFWIDVGCLEQGVIPMAPGIDQRAANRHLRTVLQAKGYEVFYYEAPGGHDYAAFRRSIAKGLQALLNSAAS